MRRAPIEILLVSPVRVTAYYNNLLLVEVVLYSDERLDRGRHAYPVVRSLARSLTRLAARDILRGSFREKTGESAIPTERRSRYSARTSDTSGSRLQKRREKSASKEEGGGLIDYLKNKKKIYIYICKYIYMYVCIEIYIFIYNICMYFMYVEGEISILENTRR